MQTCAIILTVATFIVAVLCRIYCFGHGLSQYLQYQVDDVSSDLNPAPDVIQGFDQIHFPSLHALGDEETGRRLGVEGLQHHRSGSETTLATSKEGPDEMKAQKKLHRECSNFSTMEGEEDAVELPGSDGPPTTSHFTSVNLTPGPLGTEALNREWSSAATNGNHGRVQT